MTRWVCGSVAMDSPMMVLWMSGFYGCVGFVDFVCSGGCGCSEFCGFCLCVWVLKEGGADFDVFDLCDFVVDYG